MSAPCDERPVLFLLPGLLCDRASWDAVATRLETVATCRVPDYASERSLGAMAVRVLDAAPGRFALAGHSMGGRVALEVLRRAPDRVTRVALLDTGYRALPEGEAGERERAGRLALLDIARGQDMRAMGREWVRPMVHPSRLEDLPLVEAILAMFARRTPDQFAAQIGALIARPDAEELLRAIRVPTLVACGREDGWSPPRQHEEIASLVPGARLEVFEDCGHMAPMERPEAVANALAAWLGSAFRATRHTVEAH